ncbi:MAG TPA: hypothetical protein VGR71_16665 [Nitrospira sp.]|nr:hypothetical protein [Nitrospira sp.]
MPRQIRRHAISVDSLNRLELTGDILHVSLHSFELFTISAFAEHDTVLTPIPRVFKVYQSGDFLPTNAKYVASTPPNHRGDIYHVYELYDIEKTARAEEPSETCGKLIGTAPKQDPILGLIQEDVHCQQPRGHSQAVPCSASFIVEE